MEYMAHKKAIVSFDLQENRYSAEDSAIYVKNNDFKEFGDKILYLLKSKQLREKMGLHGYNRLAQKLCWEESVPQLLKAYKSIE